jgi:hypothetical protein
MPWEAPDAQTVGSGCRDRVGNPFDNSPERNLDALWNSVFAELALAAVAGLDPAVPSVCPLLRMVATTDNGFDA